MTTPETRHRLRTLEHRLASPTPAPLDGQTAIRLTWQQSELPTEPPPAKDKPQPPLHPTTRSTR